MNKLSVANLRENINADGFVENPTKLSLGINRAGGGLANISPLREAAFIEWA